ERHRRRSQRGIRLDAELAHTFLLVRNLQIHRGRAEQLQAGAKLGFELDRSGAAGRVVEHTDAHHELVTGRRRWGNIWREDEVALHLGRDLGHAHLSRARNDGDDAELAVEVVGYRVLEIFPFWSDVDDAGPVRDRRLAFAVERIEM